MSLPKEFVDFLKQIKGKRARVVVDHILEHEFITTEDLETTYGYKHPPRAIRDVREQGVPLETFSVKNAQGRTIAAYRFGDPTQLETHRLGGRRSFSKEMKAQLLEMQEHKCAICLQSFSVRYLQIDHRIPYVVAGDISYSGSLAEYMLVCGSCNRAKSWSCEHCENGTQLKTSDICKGCYWANPLTYEHIAMRPFRRIELVWSGEETTVYETIKHLAESQLLNLPDYVKDILRRIASDLEKD